MEKLHYVLTALGDLILPRFCVVCGARLAADERFMCADCAEDIPLTYYWDLPFNPAADRLNENIQHKFDHLPAGPESEDSNVDGNSLDDNYKKSQYEPYARFAALFFYSSDNGYRHICHRLKYGGDIALGRSYSRMLGERLADSTVFNNVDLVVPVPLHRSRRWKRGYNQAEVIAREVAACLNARVSPRLLVRTRRTETQTVLSIEEKKRNVAGAFAISPRVLSRLGHEFSRRKSDNIYKVSETQTAEPRAKQWRPRHILIVDDVMTTGA
ncbi:MAG: hypothetical protein LUC24_03995, partial [Bacteroidales bacterium]|nr:hypothetical protein [Bacteroidales bacterium]